MFIKPISSLLIISIVALFNFFPVNYVNAQQIEVFGSKTIDFDKEIKEDTKQNDLEPNPESKDEPKSSFFSKVFSLKNASWGAAVGTLGVLSSSAYFGLMALGMGKALAVTWGVVGVSATLVTAVTVGSAIVVGGIALIGVGYGCSKVAVCKPIVDNILGTKGDTFKERVDIRGSSPEVREILDDVERIKQQEISEGRQSGLPENILPPPTTLLNQVPDPTPKSSQPSSPASAPLPKKPELTQPQPKPEPEAFGDRMLIIPDDPEPELRPELIPEPEPIPQKINPLDKLRETYGQKLEGLRYSHMCNLDLSFTQYFTPDRRAYLIEFPGICRSMSKAQLETVECISFENRNKAGPGTPFETIIALQESCGNVIQRAILGGEKEEGYKREFGL